MMGSVVVVGVVESRMEAVEEERQLYVMVKVECYCC